MKKILIASLMCIASGSSFAAGKALAEGATTTVNNTECTLLNADAATNPVKITLSTANLGYVDCNATTGSIGVAVANTKGKNKVYSIGSAGGAPIATDTAAAPASGNVQTAAEARSASS
jgi:hypothetical protein